MNTVERPEESEKRASSSCGEATRFRRLVDQHFAGRIVADQERVLREHLRHCPRCRDYYANHLQVAQVDPRSVSAQARIGIGLGFVSARRFVPRPLWVAAAAAMVTAVALFVLPILPRSDSGAGFRSRGAEVGCELFVYRSMPGKALRLVGSSIAPTDELAFAYRNRSTKGWLLLFGVDENKNVYWYHPAWNDRAARPEAIAIKQSPDVVELPEAVRHELKGTRLHLYAIFADQRLDVVKLERIVRSSNSKPGRPLPVAGAVQKMLTVKVDRK